MKNKKIESMTDGMTCPKYQVRYNRAYDSCSKTKDVNMNGVLITGKVILLNNGKYYIRGKVALDIPFLAANGSQIYIPQFVSDGFDCYRTNVRDELVSFRGLTEIKKTMEQKACGEMKNVVPLINVGYKDKFITKKGLEDYTNGPNRNTRYISVIAFNKESIKLNLLQDGKKSKGREISAIVKQDKRYKNWIIEAFDFV